MTTSTVKTDTVDRVVAIVGDSAITFNELRAAVYARLASQEIKPPTSPAEEDSLLHGILSTMVDEEILAQKAADLKLEVNDSDILPDVDAGIRQIRSQFKNDAEYRSELKKAGFGSPEVFRRYRIEQARRQLLQQKAYRKLSESAKPGNVTEDEVTKAYEAARTSLQRRPATVAFRQIVVAPACLTRGGFNRVCKGRVIAGEAACR